MAKAWDFADTSGSITFDPSRCAKCGTAGLTFPFVSEGGAVGYVHGQYQYWCRRCILKARIAYAETQVLELHTMRDELAALDE